MKLVCEGKCVRMGEMKKMYHLRCGKSDCPAQDFEYAVSAFERMERPRRPQEHKAPPGSLLEDAYGRGATALGGL